MKIEQLIVQHLYNSKKVTLQGIGTFKLNPAVILPAENDKERDFIMPENAFEFEYNLKAAEDEGLIKYIVQHTRKILPLASADLDSYVMLAKQFLNIGKPLVIEGVGTIQKNQVGNYQFTPGNFISPRIDDIPKQLREKRDETVSFESDAPANNNRRNGMMVLALLIIAAAAFVAYYLFTQNKTDTVVPVAETVLEKDTVAVGATQQPMMIDSNTSSANTTTALKTDSSNFKIVLKKYTSAHLAQKAFERLSSYGHKLMVAKMDSLTYELAMPFYTPLSDSTRARDSLRHFFGGKPFVRL